MGQFLKRQGQAALRVLGRRKEVGVLGGTRVSDPGLRRLGRSQPKKTDLRQLNPRGKVEQNSQGSWVSTPTEAEEGVGTNVTLQTEPELEEPEETENLWAGGGGPALVGGEGLGESHSRSEPESERKKEG